MEHRFVENSPIVTPIQDKDLVIHQIINAKTVILNLLYVLTMDSNVQPLDTVFKAAGPLHVILYLLPLYVVELPVFHVHKIKLYAQI